MSDREKKENKDRMLLPSEVVTIEQAQEIIGDEYVLKLKDSALIQDANKVTAKYISEPLGAGDGVFIDIYEPSESFDEDAVMEKFEASRKKRTDFITLEDMGDDAYIAYPTLHLYSHGVYVAITAGSANTEEQMQLLTDLGEVAEKNLSQIFD